MVVGPRSGQAQEAPEIGRSEVEEREGPALEVERPRAREEAYADGTDARLLVSSPGGGGLGYPKRRLERELYGAEKY